METSIKKSKYFTLHHYKNNYTYYLLLFFYILISIGLVNLQLLYIHPNSILPLKFARASGILISFNMICIIMLVMRKTNTWLRGTIIGRMLFPFDDFIDIHKAVGVILLILSTGHTVAHAVNLCN